MKYPFKIGDWVQSHFRANWKGRIENGPDKNNCYVIKVLIDSYGNPVRKPWLTTLNHHWLESY